MVMHFPKRVAGTGGKVRLGCVVGLVLLGAGAYYGIPIGKQYITYYRMLDEMRSLARLGPSLENDPIRRRLVQRAEELLLPPEASKFTIRRLGRPREIVITTQWQDTLRFEPFYRLPITFKPEAREPL